MSVQQRYLHSLSKQEGMTCNIKSPQAVLLSRVIDLRRVKPTFTLRYGRTDANNSTAHVYSRADRTKRDEE